MDCTEVRSFEELIEVIHTNHGVACLGRNNDPARHELYDFGNSETRQRTHVLKKVSKDSPEVETYRVYLPKINSRYKFRELYLPSMEACFRASNDVYLLLPYYEGDHPDAYTNNIQVGKDMVDIVTDLAGIDVEGVLKGGSSFDAPRFEESFWEDFNRALEIGLIHNDEISSIKPKVKEVFNRASNTQRMIISNGDFNPRNIIRATIGLILIDWNSIVCPLEHHLTYPWLINWRNKDWQRTYATEFESQLPVNIDNIRMNLMNISLKRAVSETSYKEVFAEQNVADHIRNFHLSLREFKSLTEL